MFEVHKPMVIQILSANIFIVAASLLYAVQGFVYLQSDNSPQALVLFGCVIANLGLLMSTVR